MPFANAVTMGAITVTCGLAMLLVGRHRRAHPVFWFLGLQWLIAVGTLAIADFKRESDVAYAAAFFVAVASVSVGQLVTRVSLSTVSRADRFWAQPVESDDTMHWMSMLGLTLVSVLVTYWYYRAVGYNILISLVRGDVLQDVVSLRLATYSGTEYFAPGYVNQFKNVLLPLGLSFLVLGAWHTGRVRTAQVIGAVGVPIALWALLGTGQRGPFVYAAAALTFGLAALGTIRWRALLILASLGLVLFGAMSFYIGRIGDFDALSIVSQVVRRAFVSEQTEGLVGFRYVYQLPTAWFDEWTAGLMGILPGHPGSDLDHVIFGLINGTTRGTSTLPTVGSVYYNGGWAGIVAVYLALGAAYSILYHCFISGRRTVLRCLTYGALFFHLSFFVAGAPVSLINKGVLALFGVLLIRRLGWATDATAAASGRVVAA